MWELAASMVDRRVCLLHHNEFPDWSTSSTRQTGRRNGKRASSDDLLGCIYYDPTWRK